MDVSILLTIALLMMIMVVAALAIVLLRLTGDMKKIDFSKLREEEENEYEEEIMNIAQEGHEQGVILADEAQMISNIFEFGDKDVKDVMQFRQKIVGIEAGTSLKDAIDFMVTQHYSRYPVYEEDLDHIIGILNFRDAVNCWLSEPDKIVNEIVRKPVYVHEAMDINELLTQMKNSKIHQAIVVDEFGQTVGLVAMEDILETIVGDILDEYDVEEKEIVKLPGENGYIASGMIRLDKLEELLDITFDTDEIGGAELVNPGLGCRVEEEQFRVPQLVGQGVWIERHRIVGAYLIGTGTVWSGPVVVARDNGIHRAEAAGF